MSGRCKSCDAILSDDEMKTLDVNGEYVETCSHCRAVYYETTYTNDDPSQDFYREGVRQVHRYD